MAIQQERTRSLELPHIDWILLFIVIALLAIGLILGLVGTAAAQYFALVATARSGLTSDSTRFRSQPRYRCLHRWIRAEPPFARART